MVCACCSDALNDNHDICSNCIAQILPFACVNDEDFESNFLTDTSNVSQNSVENFSHILFNPFRSNSDFSPVNYLLDPDRNFFESASELLDNCEYFLEDQFNNSIGQNHVPENFSLFHLNVRSQNKNFEMFENLLNTLDVNFSAIALTETWLNDSHDISYFNLPGYVFINVNRNFQTGGGVGLYIKDDLRIKRRDDLNFVEAESLFVDVIDKFGKQFLVGVIYRPPDKNLEEFIDELDVILAKVDSEGKSLWLTGDFNINLLNTENDLTSYFLNRLFSYSYFPLISKPTRVTNHSATLIDNIFTNSLENNIKSGVLITDISDHFGIFTLSNFKLYSSNLPKFVTKRCFTDKNINEFSESLSNCDWSSLENSITADHAYDSFTDIFSDKFEKHFPLKRIKIKPPKLRKPWMTTGLATSCKTKTRLFYRYKQYPSEYRHNKYKTYRNKLNFLQRTAKKEYFSNQFDLAKHDLKQTWKTIKQALNKPLKKESKSPQEFKLNDSVIHDGEVSKFFNDFFSNIGPTLDKNIPNNNIDFRQFLRNKMNSTFTSFKLTNENEIIEIITHMKNISMSSGWDEIPGLLIRKICHIISKPLSIIINISLNSGVFPDKLKIAKVIPVFKSGDPSSFSNYRPISILPFFSKIYEKIVYKRLLFYLDENNILNPCQFGFRRKHSTAHAITYLINKISEAIDKKDFTLGIFIDLSKAFDTVNHNILLDKLMHYGINGVILSWFTSYLQSRKQYTLYNGINSKYLNITCGVPQGSILGPLLFLIYVNDLSYISSILNTIMFADDTNFFYSHSNVENLISTVNIELAKCSVWLNANRLSLNMDKTHFILFSSNKKYFPPFTEHVKINDAPIHNAQTTKFLGITLDKNLSWKTHISNISSKIAKNIGIINKIKSILPERILLSLYYTMVFPYLSYCNIVWASTYPTHLKRLFILQKRIVRIITSSNYRDHSLPLFSKLNILNVSNINFLQTASFVFNFLKGNLPQTFNNFFMKNSSYHSYNTRSCNDLHCSRPRTRLYDFSIRCQGPKIWNSLPNYIKEASHYTFFKHYLKQFLIHNLSSPHI